MRLRRSRRLTAPVLVMLTLLSLAAQGPAWAQSGDKWSFVITPQVWLSHIAKNGFAAAPDPSVVGGVAFDPTTGDLLLNTFPSSSSPKNDINPQWGIQLAAQKGRLTLAGAFQYVEFDTINSIRYTGGIPVCLDFNNPSTCVNPGERWAHETVETTRMDVDLSASYFFPDVVKDWVDVSLGAGFKFIYAYAKRSQNNLSPLANILDTVASPPGLYTICLGDPCADGTFKWRVKEESYLYAATFPMSAIVHLTNDGRWLLPFSVSPLLGAEVRNDMNVVYNANPPANIVQLFSAPNLFQGLNVQREDGTTFAYGVTADATVRWIINETLSAYAGMRVQYIHGHDTYLAYGPLLGMSFRFGGK